MPAVRVTGCGARIIPVGARSAVQEDQRAESTLEAEPHLEDSKVTRAVFHAVVAQPISHMKSRGSIRPGLKGPRELDVRKPCDMTQAVHFNVVVEQPILPVEKPSMRG